MLTVEDHPHGCGGPQLLAKGHGAERRTAFSSHETQRVAPDREYARCWWTYQRHRGMPGPWCCFTNGHPSEWATTPKTGGRLSQAPAGTNPTTGQSVVIFLTSSSAVTRGQFDKSPFGQSEISPTSCLSACWRLWYRRCYRSTVSLGMLSAVRFPLVSYFSLCVLVVYFHVSSSSPCVSRLERWKKSYVLVVVEFQLLSELGLCVFREAPPLKGRWKSPRRV